MKYREAIAQETLDIMEADPRVIVMGEGVADPKGIFGTTKPAHDNYPDRVIETPLSENMLTGALAGLACEGWKPIYVHARAEFSLLAWEHMVNTIAKWPWLHGGQQLPIIIRVLVGRGWGQGPTHSQSFHGMLSQVPGLEVRYPVDPETVGKHYQEAYKSGLPTIIIEPRRMYEEVGNLPHDYWSGTLVIVTIGDIVLDAITAASIIEDETESAVRVLPVEQFDQEYMRQMFNINTYAPWDDVPVIICDTMSANGYGIVQNIQNKLRTWMNMKSIIVAPPTRPLPTTAHLESLWYPSADDILDAAENLLDIKISRQEPISTEKDGRKEPF